MLGRIAARPKTLSERIRVADNATMIKKVFIENHDQRAWFKALLSTEVFDSEDAMKCIGTWARLCDKDDVKRLLELSHRLKNNDTVRQLVFKCASTLYPQQLTWIMSRYFFEYKFNGLTVDTEVIESQMKLIFNKTNSETDFVKDMCLLLLWSPIIILKGVYGECIKANCYINRCKELFATIKEGINRNNICILPLWQAMLCNRPNPNNVDNYIALLTTLQEIGYLSSNQIINNLLLALLELYQPDQGFEQLGYILQIFLVRFLEIFHYVTK